MKKNGVLIVTSEPHAVPDSVVTFDDPSEIATLPAIPAVPVLNGPRTVSESVPLAGGVVLHMKDLAAVKAVLPEQVAPSCSHRPIRSASSPVHPAAAADAAVTPAVAAVVPVVPRSTSGCKTPMASTAAMPKTPSISTTHRPPAEPAAPVETPRTPLSAWVLTPLLAARAECAKCPDTLLWTFAAATSHRPATTDLSHEIYPHCLRQTLPNGHRSAMRATPFCDLTRPLRTPDPT